MSNRLGGKQGTAYTGTNANQPPNWTFNDRPPTIYDSQNVSEGDLWLDRSDTHIKRVWVLVSLAGNSMSKGVLAEWVQLGSGSLKSLKGNSGGPVFPDVNANINVVGDGTTIDIVGNPGSNTLTVSTIGSGVVNSLTGNSGGAVFPTAGNINVVGTGVITVVGNPGTSTLTVTPSGDIASSFPTDSGTATPAAGVLNILAQNATLNCGSTVKFTGSGNTVLLNVTDLVATNTIIGGTAGNLTLTGTANSGLGSNVLHALTSGVQNCAWGTASSQSMTTGSHNVLGGVSSGANMTSASENVGIGRGSLVSLVSGVSNLALGDLSGGSLVGAESSNILINHTGVAAESNTIRIGTQGGGAAQQNRAFMAGVYGITPAIAAPRSVIIDSAGQLGTTILPVSSYAFSVYASADIPNVTGNGTAYTILFNTVTYDLGANYNAATGIFTAPVDGIYQFNISVTLGNVSTSDNCNVALLTTPINYEFVLANISSYKDNNAIVGKTVSVAVLLLATQTAKVSVRAVDEAGDTIGINQSNLVRGLGTFFMGYRIG